jgi:5'(3')-deoxyribonucleotidase
LVPGTERTVTLYNQIWNTRVPLEQAHNPNAAEWGATSVETHSRRINDIYLTKEYAKVAPYQDAVEAIKRLAQQHELHLVTARPETLEGVTERMIEQYFTGCFSSICHIGFYGSKGDICLAVGADVLIDDNVRHLDNARLSDVTRLIWFGDYPWNRLDTSGQDVVRCLDWSSVEKEIERIANS